MSDFKLDIIVPHLNYSKLRRSLETLRNNTPPERIGQVILIDQNDTYQEVDDLVDIHVKIKNQGFARANNLGIRLSQAEYVGCLNDDVEFLHPKWIDGIIETFNRYDTALCVNPASPRNPESSGGKPVDHPDYPYKENWTEEEYDKIVRELGKGHILDGICMFFPIFRRKLLDELPGSIPGKCWFDEAFKTGGGEDYDMNRRAYLSGLRCLGSNLAYVYHWWYSTKRPETGEAGVKYDNYFVKKWAELDESGQPKEMPDLYGKKGHHNIPINTLRQYE